MNDRADERWRKPSASGLLCDQETTLRPLRSSLGSRRIQDGVYSLEVLPCVGNSVDVDAFFGQPVVNRKRESLGKRPMETAIGLMDASINPQKFDVRDKAIIDISAKT